MPTLNHPLWRRVALLGALAALAACSRNDPQSLVQSAREYLAKSDSSAAIIQLKNALQAAPENPEARVLLARALLESGDAAGAEAEAHKAIDLHASPDEAYPVLVNAVLAQGDLRRVPTLVPAGTALSPAARAEIDVATATLQLAQNKLDEARASAASAAKVTPDNPRLLLVQSRIAAASNDLPEALRKVDAAIAKSPGQLEPVLLKAQVLAASNDRDGAIKVLEEAVAAHPKSIAPRVAVVPMLLAANRIDAAGEHVAKLRENAPNNIRTLYADALYSYSKGDPSHARDALQKLLATSPDNLPAMMLDGLVQYQLGSYAAAEDVLRRVVARAPNDVAARRALAATYVRSNRAGQALDIVGPLLQANVQDASIWRTAGEAAIANGNTALAEQYFERAAGLDEGNLGTKVRLAQVRMATGESERAFRDLEAISASDHASGQADLALVTGHLQRREYDQALAAADALVKKQPDNATAHGVRGSVFLARRDLVNARASFEKAFALDPKSYAAAYNLALIDVREGKPEAARARYDAMLQKDPTDEQLLLAQADLLVLQSGATDQARKLVERAIAAHPASPRPRLALIGLATRDRDPKAALTAAEAAQAAIPNDPQISNALAAAQVASGNPNAAVETYRRAAQGGGDSRDVMPLLRLAEAQAINHDMPGAIATARKATAAQPNDARGWLLLAKLMLASGQTDQAIGEARRLQKDPTDEQLLLAQADLLVLQSGATGEARKLVERAIAVAGL